MSTVCSGTNYTPGREVCTVVSRALITRCGNDTCMIVSDTMVENVETRTDKSSDELDDGTNPSMTNMTEGGWW